MGPLIVSIDQIEGFRCAGLISRRRVGGAVGIDAQFLGAGQDAVAVKRLEFDHRVGHKGGAHSGVGHFIRSHYSSFRRINEGNSHFLR